MTLRLKTLLIVGLSFVGLILVIYAGLRSHVTRNVGGLQLLWWLTASLVVVVFLFGVVILLLLEKMVTSKLASLNSEIHRIGTSGDLSRRLPQEGADEIAGVSIAVNSMLEALERSHRRLSEGEERYRRLVELSPDCIAVHQDGVIVYINQSGARMMGARSPEELIGKSVIDFVHPDYRETALQQAAEVSPGPLPLMEGKLLRLDGIAIDVEMTDIPFTFEGRPAAQVVVRDITSRKLAEQALRASEEKYRELVENIDEVLYALDERGVVTYVSNAIESLGGYKASDLIGKSFIHLIHEEDQPFLMRNFQSALSGKVEPYEYRAFDGSGQIHWIRTSSRPIYDGDRIVGLRGVLADITSRKHAEEALAAEKERLAVTLRSIGDGVIATDTAGRIVLVNKAAEQMTGWSQQEALGKPLGEVFRILDEKTREPVPSPVERVLATGQVVALAGHITLIAADGSERAIADSGAPIRDQQSRIIGVVVAFRDVTEKQKMESEMLKTSKLESLGVLAGGIAHDFNNILTAILANISLAKSSLLTESVRSHLEEAEQACLRAKDLTQQLLTFSKGGLPVLRTASVTEVLKDSAGFALAGSNVRCEFDLPRSLWPVEIDEGQISQVIHNLTLNAQQAMPQGGTIRIRAENLFSEATFGGPPIPAGRYVKISVSDSGTGIPEEHLPRIFDPYFTTKQKGSGLGLATSYSMIRKHDGYITVDSLLGEGTTFVVYLPASAKEIPQKKDEHQMTSPGSGKVLLMDDEDHIRTVTSEILRMLGYEVEAAADGDQAVEIYRQALEEGRPFDAVILDLTIRGGMGGKETIRKLQEIDPKVKAIVSSGYSNDPIMAGFRQYGFSGIVSKPYRVAELKKALNDVIERRSK